MLGRKVGHERGNIGHQCEVSPSTQAQNDRPANQRRVHVIQSVCHIVLSPMTNQSDSL